MNVQNHSFHFTKAMYWLIQAIQELGKVGGINKILVAEDEAYGGFLAGWLFSYRKQLIFNVEEDNLFVYLFIRGHGSFDFCFTTTVWFYTHCCCFKCLWKGQYYNVFCYFFSQINVFSTI